MRLLAERMKQVVEPTGALAAAALLHGAQGLPDLRGARVGAIISGGNVDLLRFSELMAGR
jgi:threonine dehydratase